MHQFSNSRIYQSLSFKKSRRINELIHLNSNQKSLSEISRKKAKKINLSQIVQQKLQGKLNLANKDLQRQVRLRYSQIFRRKQQKKELFNKDGIKQYLQPIIKTEDIYQKQLIKKQIPIIDHLKELRRSKQFIKVVLKKKEMIAQDKKYIKGSDIEQQFKRMQTQFIRYQCKPNKKYITLNKWRNQKFNTKQPSPEKYTPQNQSNFNNLRQFIKINMINENQIFTNSFTNMSLQITPDYKNIEYSSLRNSDADPNY